MKQLRSDLERLGICPGDVVLMHSSLSALGYVPGGADTVIDTLKELLTEEGTLLIPSLSYENVDQDNPFFDIRTTPACIGLIPETFRRRDDVVRSMHPTHSVSAWGKYAKELVRDHYLDNTPVGPNSPFRKLMSYGGKILMLGCTLESLTFMHGVEEVANVPYLLTKEPWHYHMTDYDGTVTEIDSYHHNDGPDRLQKRFGRILNVLSPDEYTVGDVLKGKAYLLDANAVMQRAVATIEKDPYYFVEAVK